MLRKLSPYHRQITITADTVSIAASLFLIFLFRFDFHLPGIQLENIVIALPIVIAIRLAVMAYTGVYRIITRYASLSDIWSIVKSIFIAQLFIVAVLLFVRPGYPRSILIFEPILALFFIGMSRYAIRATRNFRYAKEERKNLPKILIFGAGDMGESLLRDLMHAEAPTANVIGFLDDNPNKWNRLIHTYTVFGGREKLPEIINEYGIDEIIVAIRNSKGQIIQNLIDIYSRNIEKKVVFKTVPSVDEVIAGRTPSTHVRDIKLSDLLNRKPVNLNLAAVNNILHGKVVLVTGAGGTIGSEFCRQAMEYCPKRLIMLDNNNTALFYIDKEIREKYHRIKFCSVAGDVRDQDTLNNIFETYHPDIIFHAAAHKHVPLMETNPQEAVKNNLVGTALLADTAVRYNAERFLFISTDKAVRPTSVMGATKHLAELAVRAFSSKNPGTRFMAVRFGNVLGSSGSAIQIFQQQISEGGPITVTDERATRYFMTTKEAVQLILQACTMGHGGEIFVLNMGTSVKVVDIAKNLIALHGLVPGKDIEIKFTGLRPGEKLYEELFRDEDVRRDTGHDDIFMAIPEMISFPEFEEMLAKFEKAVKLHDPVSTLELIQKYIPTYTGHPLLNSRKIHGVNI